LATTSGSSSRDVTKPMWKEIAATGVGRKSTLEARAEDHTIIVDEPKNLGGENRGPSPLHTMLAALMGCETATTSYVARKQNIQVHSLTYDLKAVYDLRGIMGMAKDVPARFQRVYGTVVVDTSGTQAQVEELGRQMLTRCPVANLFAAAGVKMDVKWTKKE